MQRVAWAEKLLDGNDLNLWELPVVGLKEASGCGLRDHASGRRLQRQKHAHFGSLLIHGDDEILHHRRIEALAALDRDDDFFGLLAIGLYIGKAVHAAVAALLAAFVRLGVDHRERPFLELVFVLQSKCARSVEAFWDAGDVKLDSGKRVFQTPLDKMNSEMRNVDADPATVQFLRGMDGGAAAAKGIENEIAFVGGGGDDAFEQRERFLGGIAEVFASRRDLNIVPIVL